MTEVTDIDALDDEKLVYLIEKYGGYYRPDCSGYTNSPFEAGRYTERKAYAESHPNGADGPRDGMSYIHIDDVPAIAEYEKRHGLTQPAPIGDVAELVERWAKVRQHASAIQGGVDKPLHDDTVAALTSQQAELEALRSLVGSAPMLHRVPLPADKKDILEYLNRQDIWQRKVRETLQKQGEA